MGWAAGRQYCGPQARRVWNASIAVPVDVPAASDELAGDGAVCVAFGRGTYSNEYSAASGMCHMGLERI